MVLIVVIGLGLVKLVITYKKFDIIKTLVILYFEFVAEDVAAIWPQL